MQTLKKNIKLIALIAVLAALWAYSALPSAEPAFHEEDDAAANSRNAADVGTDLRYGGLIRYEQYSAKYAKASRPAVDLRIEAESFAGTDGMQANVLQSFEGAPTPVVRTEESGSTAWNIDVPEDGLYHLGLRYYPIEGNSSPIERELSIDGKNPFDESKRLVFPRVWSNSEVERDANGNDLRPAQFEKPAWQEAGIADSEGYYREPFSFYFTKGRHTLALISLREPMVIDYIRLYQKEKIPSYQEYIQAARERSEQTQGVFVKEQGEHAVLKSSPSLYPLNDRSSPATEPYDVSKIRMNTIGGINWKSPGEWIAWDLDIPKDGLYELGIKYRQNLARGVQVVRKLYIDDQVPFQEAMQIPFKYGGAWQTTVPGTEDEPYLFYLTKGSHRIKLEVTMGELAETIRMVRSSIQQLNALYLKIIMITGTDVDPFRDYELETQIPEMTGMMLAQSKILNKAAAMMDRMIGETSENTTLLQKTAYQLNDLGNNPETVTGRLDSLKENISSLGTWLISVNQQPLEIDYLFAKSPDVETPSPRAGFFSSLEHEVASFGYSFFENYNRSASLPDDDNTVTVWINGGRDQAQLLRTMIDNDFTPQTGIKVNLKLVGANVLLPATLAGQGPDVAVSAGEVVNFAMRNALEDLSRYPDFDAVQARFMDSAFAGFKYNGGIYAIPEKQTFPMLFYRKDIFERLNLQVPQTWDDMYEVIPELQKQHMQIGMTPTPVFDMLLYQGGGSLYERDGIATGISSPAGNEAFKKWTELYTNYKLPQTFDFINRFRTGEMPLGIADYSTYNTLAIFAPEIRGQWEFAPVPGTVGADGQIHREALSASTGAVLFKKAKHKEAGWAFIKWWTDTDAQVTFGREMESIFGESGRYAAANVEALKRLPWPTKDYKQLLSQWVWVRGTPDVPGGYSLSRHLTNAFFEVLNNGSDPQETLKEYVRTINREITTKREEFQLPTQ